VTPGAPAGAAPGAAARPAVLPSRIAGSRHGPVARLFGALAGRAARASRNAVRLA